MILIPFFFSFSTVRGRYWATQVGPREGGSVIWGFYYLGALLLFGDDPCNVLSIGNDLCWVFAIFVNFRNSWLLFDMLLEWNNPKEKVSFLHKSVFPAMCHATCPQVQDNMNKGHSMEIRAKVVVDTCKMQSSDLPSSIATGFQLRCVVFGLSGRKTAGWECILCADAMKLACFWCARWAFSHLSFFWPLHICAAFSATGPPQNTNETPLRTALMQVLLGMMQGSHTFMLQ